MSLQSCQLLLPVLRSTADFFTESFYCREPGIYFLLHEKGCIICRLTVEELLDLIHSGGQLKLVEARIGHFEGVEETFTHLTGFAAHHH